MFLQGNDLIRAVPWKNPWLLWKGGTGSEIEDNESSRRESYTSASGNGSLGDLD